ncbi:hypothetical protein BKA83DRAFT_4125932 [Pisolithus microcarpus]|nr:hypothetical protein BKA83DRAFT_4125932 [Pisolithus microcarpus]
MSTQGQNRKRKKKNHENSTTRVALRHCKVQSLILDRDGVIPVGRAPRCSGTQLERIHIYSCGHTPQQARSKATLCGGYERMARCWKVKPKYMPTCCTLPTGGRFQKTRSSGSQSYDQMSISDAPCAHCQYLEVPRGARRKSESTLRCTHHCAAKKGSRFWVSWSDIVLVRMIVRQRQSLLPDFEHAERRKILPNRGFASHNCTVELKREIFMSEVEDKEVLSEARHLTRGVSSAPRKEFGRKTENFASAMMKCQAR